MTWAKLDDGLYDDPRSEAAGIDAMGLWALALSYMARYSTDGWIALDRCRKIAGRRAVWLAAKLVDVGWWEKPEEGGGAFRLVGWESFLIPREVSEERSARAAAAGAKGGRARRAAAEPTPEPPPEPRANPQDELPGLGEVRRGVRTDKSAETLDTSQATRAPDPDPTRPDPNAPARARAGDRLQPGQASLFDPPSRPSSEATPIPGSHERVKAPGPPKPPRAQDEYVRAWVSGIELAGYTVRIPTATEGRELGRICAAHARTKGGQAIVGKDLRRWIRREAAIFRRAIDTRFSQVSVHAFGVWQDKGRPDADDAEEELPPVREPLRGNSPLAPPQAPRGPVSPERQQRALRKIWQIQSDARVSRGEAPLDLETGLPIVEAAHG